MRVATLPEESLVDEVGPVAGVEVRAWDLVTDPPGAEEIELVVPPYIGSRKVLAKLSLLPRLHRVQLLTAGYEDVLRYLPPGVEVANGAGVHDASTAELALTLTLASLRGVPSFVRAQDRSEWVTAYFRPALADKRVLIMGYGSIGRAVAARMAPFEVHLSAVASRPRPGDDLVEEVHGVDELPDLLPHTDVVVLVVPLTDATRGLVGKRFLAALPDGALVVNVSRGKVVDTDALLAELAAGRLTAALDVTDPEPLPSGHPLWTAPGLLVSPHVGGASSAFRPRAVALLRRELGAWGAGKPLARPVAVG